MDAGEALGRELLLTVERWLYDADLPDLDMIHYEDRCLVAFGDFDSRADALAAASAYATALAGEMSADEALGVAEVTGYAGADGLPLTVACQW